MRLEVTDHDGVFAPLERVEGARPGTIDPVCAEEELRDIRETVGLAAGGRAERRMLEPPGRCCLRHEKRGDIVLVSFLFTDLSSSTRRPVLVVSLDRFHERRQDLVRAAITSPLTDDRLSPWSATTASTARGRSRRS
jgi:PemK-like, MazF-like toxin of type II toxin-antitoxin system